MDTRRIINAFLLILAFYGALHAQEYVTSIPGGQVSATREHVALDLALEYFRKNGLEKSDMTIAGALCGPFLTLNPGLVQEPKVEAKGVVECEQAANQALQRALDQALPKLSDEELQRQAEQKYPLYKVGDRVRINFSANNQTTKTVDGIYYGTLGSLVKVGKFRIRLDDMANIEGNDVEILKFSPDATEELRKKYIQQLQYDNAKKREEFTDEKREGIVRITIGSFSKSNEEAGYTWFDGAWLKPIDYMTAIVGKAREIYEQELQTAKQNKINAALQTIQAQITSQETRIAITPDNMRINPAEALKAKAEAEKKKAAELAQKQQGTGENAENQGSATTQNETANQQQEGEGKAGSADGSTQSDEPNAEEEEEKGPSILSRLMLPIIGTFLVLCVIGLLVGVATKIKRVKERDRFKKFFEGKGKLQKDFWDMVAADPENFKYVAYMFPTLKAASEALQKLSYIVANPNGDLRCTRDNLMFGVYPHQDGAVAFIGGADFRYAAWREATAVLPELEGAKYFKVSTEPSVMLDIPDIDKMATEQNIKIENLGIEEIRDENGSFTRCYKYKTETKDMAMLFLENFQINEEGIIVQVETPEGIFGKDENGIYAA